MFLSIWVAGTGNWGRKVKEFLIKRNQFSGILTIADIEAEQFIKKDRRLLWVTYPPGNRKLKIILSALRKGFDVLIEKPLMFSPAEIKIIQKWIHQTNCRVFVNYQYNYCNAVLSAKKKFASFKNILFEGTFFATSKNTLNLDPKFNLGSHILSIRQNHFPDAQIGSISYGYGKDERNIRLTTRDHTHLINLTKCNCNTLGGLLDDIEMSIHHGSNFPLTLEFGLTLEKTEMRK